MTELTDKMRTCAAFIVHATGERAFADDIVRVVNDAADLLIEASNVIDEVSTRPLVEVKPAALPPVDVSALGQPTPRSPSTCPSCDSRATKRVYREGRKMLLVCPVCGNIWEYKPKAEWR